MMREVVIQIPTLETEQNIEIDVKINGKKRMLKYRVQIIDWEEEKPTSEAKINTIRKVIREHDKDWELIQIGAPIKDSIPIMFRKKNKEEVQNSDTR
ncbi:MAG: hypothetical protein GY855_01760 [candidate division Zixibacteria bacterium]|nr:hypothetical protein [candidate division Zixibacteria bacterium]